LHLASVQAGDNIALTGFLPLLLAWAQKKQKPKDNLPMPAGRPEWLRPFTNVSLAFLFGIRETWFGNTHSIIIPLPISFVDLFRQCHPLSVTR